MGNVGQNMEINAIDKLTGQQFEKFLEKVIPKLGFQNIEKTKSTGDFGADLVAYRNDNKFTIQAKRYRRRVGIKAVQEVFSSMRMYEADSCMVISNQEFTYAAQKLAVKCKCVLFGKKQIQNLLSDNFSTVNELMAFLSNENISKFRITNDQLIDAYFTLKKERGQAIRVEDMDALGLYSSSAYRRRWGSWNSFLKSIKEPLIQEKNIDKKLLIEDFKRVKVFIGKVPSTDEFRKHSRYSVATFERVFGGWNAFLKSMDEKVNKNHNITQDEFIAGYKRVKKILGHPPSSFEMRKHGNIAPNSYKKIWGSWSNFLKKFGEPYQRRNIAEKDLIKGYLKLKKQLGKKTLTQKDMDKFGEYSSSVYGRRYGSWNKFLRQIGEQPNSRRDISKDDLIADYNRIKLEIKKKRLSANDIKLHSEFSLSTYLKKFGKWNDFLKEVNEID
jgi:hypothetical protein